jgi:hypothetical protein
VSGEKPVRVLIVSTMIAPERNAGAPSGQPRPTMLKHRRLGHRATSHEPRDRYGVLGRVRLALVGKTDAGGATYTPDSYEKCEVVDPLLPGAPALECTHLRSPKTEL